MNPQKKHIIILSEWTAFIQFVRLRKNLTVCLIFLLIHFFSVAQNKNIVIRVIQDQSTLLTDFETIIPLKKKAFKIQVMLENTPGVYVFASLKDSIYRFTENGPIRDFVYLPLLEMQDDEFNEEKELRISETGWSYWFYDPKANGHSFNRKVVKLDSTRFVGIKYFKKIFYAAESKEIRLKSIETPLYLFFVGVAEYDMNGKPLKELIRKKVKIYWIEEE
ncbi:MAG: hypothetical protein WBC06_07720 [Chitinophagaceae bacterium]